MLFHRKEGVLAIHVVSLKDAVRKSSQPVRKRKNEFALAHLAQQFVELPSLGANAPPVADDAWLSFDCRSDPICHKVAANIVMPSDGGGI